MTTAGFEVADISDFGGYDGRFGTIVDSTLFHSMPVGLRDGYQRSIVRAAAPGGSYFVLVFDADHARQRARTSGDRRQLRAAVEPYWVIDEIRPARIHADVPEELASMADFAGGDLRDESQGRTSMPAWPLWAHLG